MLNVIRRLRAQLRERYARRWNVPEIPFSLQRLAALGFQPELIFDVGAYKGDFARLCLATWPGRSVACFEALEARDADLRALTNQEPSVRVFRTLLGAGSKTDVPLNTNETVSSVLAENGRENVPVQLCRMRTVDEVVATEFSGRGPDFLKLDVQGYELEVLKGAVRTLGGVKVILLEGNFLDIYRGVPLFSEIVGWLAERGWVAYDICGIVRRPLDDALWQADFIFVPEQSFLRAKKHWD